MPVTTLSLLVGLALGAALAFGGFTEFVLVAVGGALGALVGKVIEGDIDLTPYLGGANRRRS